jgi:8-oxo-dGTP diphosphatase
MPEPSPPRQIRAAGAVLWRAVAGPAGPAVQVALVHRPRYDDWTFPKGKAKPGEHPLLTAVREVAEETGVRPVLGRPLRPAFYQADGRPKRVDYWTATPAAVSFRGQIPNGCAMDTGDDTFHPGDEVDQMRWLPLAAAARRLSYERDASLLREFAAAPVATVPCVFLRHASAGDKRDWHGDDLLRPLDPAGRAAAAALAGLLACYGPARVFSSAAARCVETVLPYAVQSGVQVTAEPVLTLGWAGDEGRGAGGGAAAREWLGGVLADGGAMILCVHGELIPQLLGQVLGHLGGSPPIAVGASLAKASFTVLHVRKQDGLASLAAVEEHDTCR